MRAAFLSLGPTAFIYPLFKHSGCNETSLKCYNKMRFQTVSLVSSQHLVSTFCDPFQYPINTINPGDYLWVIAVFNRVKGNLYWVVRVEYEPNKFVIVWNNPIR